MYVPINAVVFTSAFAGAISGMAASGRYLTSPSPSNYAGVAEIAGAFAQAFDQAWNSASAADQLEVQTIEEACEAYFEDRNPTGTGPFDVTAQWTESADAIIALVKAGDAYFAGEGISSPGWNTGGGGLTVTGTGLVEVIGGSVQGAALAGTTGQALFQSSTVPAFATFSGDVAPTATLGELTVVGLHGDSIPAPSGTDTVLTWTGSGFAWDPTAAPSFTGTGLALVVSGTLQTAALGGTSNQFLVQGVSQPTFVTASGDVSPNSTPGSLEVIGIRNNSVPGPTGTDNYLVWTGSGTGFQWLAPSGDVAPGSSPGTFKVTGLQGEAIAAPSGTNTVLTWTGSAFAWDPTGSPSFTGTGVALVVSGALQTAALGGTSGQVLIQGASQPAFTTLTGDVTPQSTPGDLEVTGLRGEALPAPSGTNTVLTWTGSGFAWDPTGSPSFTGTGVALVVSGALQTAALGGTSGQFLVQGASEPSFVTLSGDVTPQSTPGELFVTGLQDNALPAPSGTGTVLTWTGSALAWDTPSLAYSPATSADWNPAPTTVAGALDLIASAIPVVQALASSTQSVAYGTTTVLTSTTRTLYVGVGAGSGGTVVDAPTVASPIGVGWRFTVEDVGRNALTNPITVNGESGAIEDPNLPGFVASATTPLIMNGFSVTWEWTGTYWKIYESTYGPLTQLLTTSDTSTHTVLAIPIPTGITLSLKVEFTAHDTTNIGSSGGGEFAAAAYNNGGTVSFPTITENTLTTGTPASGMIWRAPATGGLYLITFDTTGGANTCTVRANAGTGDTIKWTFRITPIFSSS